EVQDGYAIKVGIDHREMLTHSEWQLISEGDTFLMPAPVILNKMLDCLIGSDVFGHTVPSPLLGPTEKFGTGVFPQQTVFANIDTARSVYISAINTILANHNLTPTDPLVAELPLASENTFWTRAAWTDPSVSGKSILETLGTIAERNRRATAGLYFIGDLVYVEQSDQVGVWDNIQVGATYSYAG